VVLVVGGGILFVSLMLILWISPRLLSDLSGIRPIYPA